MKTGSENKLSKTNQEETTTKEVHPLENERMSDFDHRCRFALHTEGHDAIVEASDEIIDMLLAQGQGTVYSKERTVNKLSNPPYMNYMGVFVTHLGWTQKVEDYQNTDWEALKHPGDVVGKNMLTGR